MGVAMMANADLGWGQFWIVVGLIYFAASWALWSLQPWGWLFAVILSVFALISAFFVMFDSGLGPALGAAILSAFLAVTNKPGGASGICCPAYGLNAGCEARASIIRRMPAKTRARMLP